MDITESQKINQTNGILAALSNVSNKLNEDESEQSNILNKKIKNKEN